MVLNFVNCLINKKNINIKKVLNIKICYFKIKGKKINKNFMYTINIWTETNEFSLTLLFLQIFISVNYFSTNSTFYIYFKYVNII